MGGARGKRSNWRTRDKMISCTSVKETCSTVAHKFTFDSKVISGTIKYLILC